MGGVEAQAHTHIPRAVLVHFVSGSSERTPPDWRIWLRMGWGGSPWERQQSHGAELGPVMVPAAIC